MNDQSMAKYLLEIKSKVDALVAAGSPLDSEDIIHYTEELNLAHEVTRDLRTLQISSNTVVLAAPRGRGRGRFPPNRGHSSTSSKSNMAPATPRGGRSMRSTVICQICGKQGHTAVRCKYRHDPQYTTDPPASALFTPTNSTTTSNWYLDSGASSHLTTDSTFLQSPKSYTGSNQVVLGNGQHLPMQHTGNGLLPTPSGSLQLSALNHVLNISFNLLSVHRLTSDNNCEISFSSHGYVIKDRTTPPASSSESVY
ncbi:hypothetical protein M5K25_015379 [Dendrobium thyrsiflorum]|uniref:Retrovirus-related Pol polyprotein from transposon TNT 1-94-like beta-barrel domain-containing protein n=1 Tax=Dendrobium thyrsiflorum TaxID=117978 RepID=A0ABD0UQP9_DENTH